MEELPLHPAIEGWQEEYDSLLTDSWLRKKYNRSRRWRDHARYMRTNCNELIEGETGKVVDIGTGPGEFLEICRWLGHEPIGVDAKSGDGGMGDKYLRLSQLLTQRQSLNVDYCGFTDWINQDHTHHYSGVRGINMRGSIEQCYSHRMQGIPHHRHQNCRLMEWVVAGTEDMFGHMMTQFYRLLGPGGILVIHANGSASDDWYDGAIRRQAETAGLKLVKQEGKVLHKWAK